MLGRVILTLSSGAVGCHVYVCVLFCFYICGGHVWFFGASARVLRMRVHVRDFTEWTGYFGGLREEKGILFGTVLWCSVCVRFLLVGII